MAKKVEYNYLTGHPTIIYDTLNRKIRAFKGIHKVVKIGITGRDPQFRFNEHLKNYYWKRMVVIYETSSVNYANKIENWLVNEHWADIVNQRQGGGSYLNENGMNYVYVLIA
jgi:hypothetical protein